MVQRGRHSLTFQSMTLPMAEIVGVSEVLRFMLFQVTVIADIEKTFPHVCVNQEDIDTSSFRNAFESRRKEESNFI